MAALLKGLHKGGQKEGMGIEEEGEESNCATNYVRNMRTRSDCEIGRRKGTVGGMRVGAKTESADGFLTKKSRDFSYEVWARISKAF